MVRIRRAVPGDERGICEVCAAGYRFVSRGLLPEDHIEEMVRKYYNEERVRKEITNISREWNGWFAAEDGGRVIGAADGGFFGDKEAELFVIYLDLARRREGIGRKLLGAVTADQMERGATVQWVSVLKGNRYAVDGLRFPIRRAGF